MSDKRATARLGGILALAVGLLALTQSWAAIASLNLASVHLLRGAASAISPVFPYVVADSSRSQLGQAVLWARRSLRYAGASDRISCVMLRAHLMSMSWQEAKALVESGSCTDASVRGFKAAWPVLEGLRELERGDLVGARHEFRRAMIVGSGLLSLSLDPWLERVQTGVTGTIAKSLQADAPALLVGRMVDHEWRAIPEPVSDQWSLVGYDLAEEAIEAGRLVPTSLFWRARRTDVQVPEGWQQVGALWRQDGLLVNLLPDSGFEWTQEGLTGWDGPDGISATRYTERDGQKTTVEDIAANPAGGGTIVPSIVMPVGEGCAYLMGGWIKSDGGGPTFSIVWDGVKDKPDDPAYVNVLEGPRDLPWTHVSMLIPSPKRGASGIAVYAGNWASVWPEATHSPRLVSVDDVFLIPISLPGAETCRVLSDGRSVI